jgi:hypothetical protein
MENCVQNPPAPVRGEPDRSAQTTPPFLKGGRGDFETSSTILNATRHKIRTKTNLYCS